MLLVYEGGIRVAIFTANFVEMDNSYLRSGSRSTHLFDFIPSCTSYE